VVAVGSGDTFAVGMALGGLAWDLMVEDFVDLPVRIVKDLDKKQILRYTGKGMLTSGCYEVGGAGAPVIGIGRVRFYRDRRDYANACMQLNDLPSEWRRWVIEVAKKNIDIIDPEEEEVIEASFNAPEGALDISQRLAITPKPGFRATIPFLALTPQALGELQELLLKKKLLHKFWVDFVKSEEFRWVIRKKLKKGIPVFLFSRMPMHFNKDKERSLDLIMASFPVFEGTIEELRKVLTILCKKVQNIYDFYLYGNKYWKKLFVVWNCLIRSTIYEVRQVC